MGGVTATLPFWRKTVKVLNNEQLNHVSGFASRSLWYFSNALPVKSLQISQHTFMNAIGPMLIAAYWTYEYKFCYSAKQTGRTFILFVDLEQDKVTLEYRNLPRNVEEPSSV